MKSPFYLKVIPTNAPFFCDRKEELKSLIFHAENSMNVVLYSPRRFGKTSLIKKMQAKLQNHDIESVYIDLSGVLDVDAVCKNIASGIYTYAKKEKSLIERVTKFFQNLRPVFIPDPITGDIKVDFRPIVPKTGIDLLEEVFDSFDNMIKKSGAKFNIAIDEFQEITTIKQGAQIEAFLRQKIQHQENISYIFSGSQRRILTDIFNQKKRPFYKSSINMKLPPLPEKDAINSIIAQFKNGKKRCSNEIAEQIVKTVNCYPYYIQKLCYTIFEISLKNKITEQDFETGYLKMIDQESSYFQGMENKLATGQQQLLNALAIEPVKEIFATEYTKKHNLKSTRSISTAREKLLNFDYIEQDKNSNFKLTDPIFAAWLNKKNAFIPYNAKIFIEHENPIKTIKEDRMDNISQNSVSEEKGYESKLDLKLQGKNPEILNIFICYSKNKALKQKFKEKLQKRFDTAKTDFKIKLKSDKDIPTGKDIDKTILNEMIQDCNGAILLLSTNFLNSEYIKNKELPILKEKQVPLFPVLFGSLDIERQNLLGVEKLLIYYQENKGKKLSFLKIADKEKESQIDEFINEFAGNIEDRINEIKKGNTQIEKKTFETLYPILNKSFFDYNDEHAIPLKGNRFEFHNDLQVKESIKGEHIPNVLKHILKWAKDSDAPQMFGLFGDYGTGKTFTSKMLTRKLLKETKENPKENPLSAIYLDLRLCPSKIDGKIPDINQIIEETLKKSISPTSTEIISSRTVINLVQSNKALIIFDGLDEKTVHYTEEEAGDFIRELWRVLPETKKNQDKNGKLLISCRTHYFKDIGKQKGLYFAKGREGEKNYEFCELSYLDERQIKEYLKLRLKCDDKKTDKLITFFSEIYNLKDISKRPYTLSLLCEFIPQIEDLKDKGAAINTAKFYEIFISEWLTRDDGKHNFKTRHKIKLMQNLAFFFHKEKIKNMETDYLEDWLENWLFKNEKIRKAYPTLNNDILEKDLRTATFIIRESDKDFGFAHTSLQEYFLSSYIVEQFEKTEDEIKQNLAIEIPSKETIDFIIQIFELEQDKLDKAIEKIEKIMEKQYVPKVSELFLKLWLKLKEHGLACPNPIEIHLENADLEKWKIKNINLSKSFLNNANLKEAEFKNMDLIDCDFTDANLDSAVILNCNLESSNFKNTNGNGIIFKNSNLTYTNWKNAILYFANFVKCDLENSKNLNKNQKIYFVKSPPFKTKKTKNFKINFLKGHVVWIWSCVFSPCGKFVISGSLDNTLKLWNVTTGKEIRSFKGHKSWVNSVCFSPCGNFVISGSSDNSLKLWDVKKEIEIKEFKAHKDSVLSVCFSPCGKFVISGSRDNSLKLWDVKTGIKIKEFKEHKNWVYSVCFSPCGKFIISGSLDHTLKLWDVKKGKQIKEFKAHKDSVYSVCFSPCGNFVISGSSDNSLKLWDVKTGKEIRSFKGHKDRVRSVCFSPCGNFVISGSWDNTLKLWDVKTGKKIRSFKGHKYWVQSAYFSPCGNFIISGSLFTLKLWDVKTGKEIRAFKGYISLASIISFSPCKNFIISGEGIVADKILKLWDIKTGKQIKEFKGNKDKIKSIFFSKDGTKIFSKDEKGEKRSWNIKTGKSSIIKKDFKNLCYSKNQNIEVVSNEFKIKNKKYCFLPDNTLASIDTSKNKILSASKNSWKWLGVIPESGFDRYPIEILEEWE